MHLFIGLAFAGASIEQGLVVQDSSTGVEFQGHFLFDQQITTDPNTGTTGMAIQRLRPDLRVSLGQIPVRARLQTEFAGDPKLLDGYVEIGPKNAYLRVGRGLLPTGRAELTAVPKLYFQGFSPASNASRVGREVGVMGALSSPRGRLQGGVFGNGFDPDLGLRAVGRAAFDIGEPVPYDETSALGGDAKAGLSIGTSAQWLTVGRVATVALELAAQAGRARIQSEAFVTNDDTWGAYGQGTLTLIPDLLDAGIRVDHTRGVEGDANLVEALVSTYAAGPHLRVQVGGQLDPDDLKNAPRLKLNGQLWF